MNDSVRELRKTAIDAMASRERREAIEELAERYDEVDAESRRTILETYRTVLEEATASSERELAREQLERLFDRDPGEAGPVVVRAFCDLATDARHSRDRIDAIDTLARLVRRGLPDALDELVESTLVSIAASAARDRERDHARERLAEVLAAREAVPSTRTTEATGVDELDVAAADATDVDPGGATMTAYLATSLAEHLEHSAAESPEACLSRARELGTFLEEQPPKGTDHGDVRAAVADLVEQLEVHPAEELDADRRERVASLADRVKRVYLRGDDR